MNRVRKREMDVLFNEGETIEGVATAKGSETFDGGGWFLAKTYRIHGGLIYADGPFERWTPKLLSETDTFLSFARLSARGAPSEGTILAWVREHGLLARQEPDNDSPYLDDGAVNQSPMRVKDFREASRFAYWLLRLFEMWRSDDVEALRSRMSLRPLHPPGKPERAKFADILLDGQPAPYTVAVDERLSDETILDISKKTIEVNVEVNLTGIHPVFTAHGRLVLRCPDLLSGMFFSFAALVSGKKPSAICEGCGKVIEKTRRNRSYCNSTCRSRKSRAG